MVLAITSGGYCGTGCKRPENNATDCDNSQTAVDSIVSNSLQSNASDRPEWTDRGLSLPQTDMTGKQLRDSLNRYWKSHDDEVAFNIWGIGLIIGDTLQVDLMNNSPKMQYLFRKRVFNSPILKLTGCERPEPFTTPTVADTSGVTMRIIPSICNIGCDTVAFELVNNSGRTLGFGSSYGVARQLPDSTWVDIYSGGVWTLEACWLDSGSKPWKFTARLHPKVNDYTPGWYMVYKTVGFDDDPEHKFTLGVRFRME